MTGDDSLALDSIASDYRFVLEHDTSMLEMALAAVSFEDCSLDDAVPLDRASVAYDCWLEALEALHPGHRFRGFGLDCFVRWWFLPVHTFRGRRGEWLP